ncbi:hypothetical protein F7D01_02835 [Erythrobacter sp. 3-20A1M]|uniref:hypothetical protein n=1 Tax=Erythrobacter sp. 3-20A1M TaxID=2653850 RepID=UPI001BFC33CA|nr:hypothetical protein [Erythrobacter sp. 3-20A1M]QWC56167.1 hypothetical protein F7D01_02835 [Erythrobacter sp. 3-20A1M]
MIRPASIRLSILLLTVASAPAAAQSVPDFRLPPQETPTPHVQGPVDPDNPVPAQPRVIRTPTPSASPTPRATAIPTPNPTAAPTRGTPQRQPTIVLPDTVPSATPVRRSEAAPARVAPSPTGSAAPETGATQEPAGPLSDFTSPALPPPGTDKDTAAAAQPTEPDGGLEWWMVALAVLIAAGIGFAIFRGRRHSHGSTVEAPVIERPRVDRTAAPAAATNTPASAEPGPVGGSVQHRLELTADALRVVRSFANVTLAYRFAIANRGSAPVTHLRIAGDLASAHGSAPVDRQLADASAAFPLLHEVESLAPGEEHEFKGEVRLPLQSVQPIWQGKAPLIVPLLRLVLSADEIAPAPHTLVVGRRPAEPGARLQPFRLDEQVQTYRDVATRALA